MNFGFNPPDPDKVIASLERLKDAFLRAADAETGAAKPLFESLSDKFNAVIDKGLDMAAQQQNPDPQKLMMQMMPAMMDLQRTVQQIQREASRNPEAGRVMQELQRDIQTEMSSLMGGSIPGMNNPPPRPPKPPAPPAPKPRRPNDGSFDL